MDRRQFLERSALIVLAAWPAAGCAEPTNDGDLARPAILEVLGSDQVQAIGRSYREMVPAESDAGALRRAIVDTRGRAGSGSTGSSPLDRSVRADFEQGRTVVVNGWVLSVTEARQCALLSLLSA